MCLLHERRDKRLPWLKFYHWRAGWYCIWVDFRIELTGKGVSNSIQDYSGYHTIIMYGLMNRPRRRGARRMVGSEDDVDNDGDTITPFHAAAIINAAIPRISSRSTRNTKLRCLSSAHISLD